MGDEGAGGRVVGGREGEEENFREGSPEEDGRSTWELTKLRRILKRSTDEK